MTPRLLLSPLRQAGQVLMLEREQAHHALRVLRLRDGDEIQAFDGCGARWRARLRVLGRDQAHVELIAAEPPLPESPLRVNLVQCVSAAERMDFTIEKAVELGVASIQPVLSRRGVVQLDDARAQRRGVHWRRLVSAACAQCGRDHLPEVRDPLPLAAWLAARDPSAPGWVLDPSAPVSLAQAARGWRGSSIDLLVGPEAGLDGSELDDARQRGLVGVGLGPRVLRTETAGLVAIALLQSTHGDLV